MGILDILFTNGDDISKGFKHLSGNLDYQIARDKEGRVLVMFHDMESTEQLIKKYLETQDIHQSDFSINKTKLKRKSPELLNLIQYKLCLLDDELILYKDVYSIAQRKNINKFTGKFPKYGINKYITLSYK